MTTRSMTRVAVGTTATQVVASNANRTRLVLRNVGTAIAYLGADNTITVGGGPSLEHGHDYEEAAGTAASNAVWAIAGEATHVDVMEESSAAPVAGNVVTEEVTFTETTGAGTYTGTVSVPQGATVLDVTWRNTALWTAGTSATLNVGDDDDADGFIAGVDLKAAPAADTNGAGGISTALSSTGTGAYKGGGGKYCAAAKTITATVVTVGATGNAGRSRMLVRFSLPVAVAATKA